MPRSPLHALTILTVFAAALPAQQVQEAAEPNQTSGTATPLVPGQQARGHLGAPGGDVDWYRIVLGAAADVTAFTAPAGTSAANDTVLTLRDGAGAFVRSNDDGIATGGWSELTAAALPAGTYYLVVAHFDAVAGQGSYTLDVRAAAPAAAGSAGPIANEAAENNDPRSGGTPAFVAPGARCNGTLATTGANGDWDFWRVSFGQETHLRARVAGTATHPNTPRADDLVLYLYDVATPPVLMAGPFYATNFGAWDTAFDARLPAGSYQIAVRGYPGSLAGRYYLDLFTTPAAAVVVGGGACHGRVLDIATVAAGLPAPRRLEAPVFGTTWVLAGSNLGPGAPMFVIVGFAPSSFDLGPLGAPGCSVRVAPLSTSLLLADAGGGAEVVFVVPEDLTLLGLPLHHQLAVLDGSNPLGLSTSNSLIGVIGR
jgi:hypothetical protein